MSGLTANAKLNCTYPLSLPHSPLFVILASVHLVEAVYPKDHPCAAFSDRTYAPVVPIRGNHA